MQLSDRRRHERFAFHDSAYAVIQSHDAVIGRLIDISHGGASFQYLQADTDMAEVGQLDIFLVNSPVRLSGIPIVARSDTPENNAAAHAGDRLRRRGVQFGMLRSDQHDVLHELICNHTTGMALPDCRPGV